MKVVRLTDVRSTEEQVYLFAFFSRAKGDGDEFCFVNNEFKVIPSDQQDM